MGATAADAELGDTRPARVSRSDAAGKYTFRMFEAIYLVNIFSSKTFNKENKIYCF
jgi:hypothetical protein